MSKVKFTLLALSTGWIALSGLSCLFRFIGSQLGDALILRNVP